MRKQIAILFFIAVALLFGPNLTNSSLISSASTETAGGVTFNTCLQDDSSNDIIQINSNTGDYRFTRFSDGYTLSGRGTINKRGCYTTLQHNQSDRRVSVQLDACSQRGTASIQMLSLGITLTITSRSLNNACNAITWTPQIVSQQVLVGTVSSAQASFTSSVALSNVRLSVSSQFSSFVVTSPSLFSTVPSGAAQAFTIFITIPKGRPVGMLSGIISLVSADNPQKIFGPPLPITISIQQPTPNNIPPDVTLPSPDRIITEPDLTAAQIIQDEIEIFFKPGTPLDTIKSLVSGFNGAILGSIPEINFYQVQVPQQGFQALSNLSSQIQQNPIVELVLPGFAVKTQGLPNDPGAQQGKDQLELINLPSAWDVKTGSKTFGIAVLDSFFDSSHIDLVDNISFLSRNTAPLSIESRHGTRVASIIGAKGNNGIDIAGTMWEASLQLYSAGVPGSAVGGGSPILVDPVVYRHLATIVLGLTPPRIVNSSSGYGCRNCTAKDFQVLAYQDLVWNMFINLAKEHNPVRDILWVFASADLPVNVDFTSPARLSGYHPNVISVSAVDSTRHLAPFSNYGKDITVAAPGVSVYGETPGGGFDNQGTGTSFAAPFVSGVAGLMLSANPNLTAADLKRIIQQTAQPTGNFDPEHNEVLLLDAFKAVQQATMPCTVAPSGLVGWWPGDGNANDIIGGDNGILHGNVQFVSGEVGQGFHFNGVDQFVEVPDSANLRPANVTIDAWVKFDSFDTPGASGPGLQYIVFKRSTNPGWIEAYTLVKATDDPAGTGLQRFALAIAPAIGNYHIRVFSTTVIQLGQFYHVAMTYDGSIVKLYVNGVLEGQEVANFPLNYADRPLFIGTTGEGFFDGKFNGTIDEVEIFNRALSADEIRAIYNAGSAGKCKP